MIVRILYKAQALAKPSREYAKKPDYSQKRIITNPLLYLMRFENYATANFRLLPFLSVPSEDFSQCVLFLSDTRLANRCPIVR